MTDVFCKERKDLIESQQCMIKGIKEKAEELHTLFSKRHDSDPESMHPDSREVSLAKQKLEEAVMWAVKGVVVN